MLILNENNTHLDTDLINEQCHYSVLRFKDFRNPDFYFEKLTQIEVFESASVELEIGDFKTILPYHWLIMCSDQDYVELIPLSECLGRDILVFCVNPIDGFMPRYLPIKINNIFPITSWTCPPTLEKDLLIMPLGHIKKVDEQQRGPICCIATPNKLDITRSVADIWTT